MFGLCEGMKRIMNTVGRLTILLIGTGLWLGLGTVCAADAVSPVAAIVAGLREALSDELQMAMKKTDAAGAAGLIMDVHNGTVLAKVELYVNRTLEPDEASLNWVRLPGETLIPVTVAMALDTGKVMPTDVFDAINRIHIGRITIDDHPSHRRMLTPGEAIAWTSHLAAARIANIIGTTKHQAFFRRLGLFETLPEMPSETETVLPIPWREINSMHIAFGHSSLLSPVTLLRVFSTLVNGGIRVPHATGERVLSEATSLQMRTLLRNAVTDGRSRRADVPGLAVGGTIGVMVDPGNPAFFEEERRFPAFIGAFPITEPRYAVLVLLEQPNVADKLFETAAAPVAAKVIARVAPLLGVASKL